MTQTILAFDFGEKRIGVAVGNTFAKTAQALTIIEQKNQDERFKAIERLIDEWQPDFLVVGLPMYPDGVAHEMTRKAQRFGNQLKGRFQKNIVWVDERYSSVAVARGDDALSAELILGQFFQSDC
jgi:putative Holliday junction resolvase